MKNLIFVTLLLLLPQTGFSCGFWEFKDLETNKDYRFLVSSIEEVGTPSVRFVRASDKNAEIINGDILKYDNNIIRFYKHGFLGRKRDKPKNEKTIGRFKDDTIIIDGYGEFKLAVSGPDEKSNKLTVTNKEGRLVGAGEITAACRDSIQYQKRRLIAFYAFKSLNLSVKKLGFTKGAR